MSKGLFITGTDTDAGKTVITGAITAACKERGIDVIPLKPVASGGVNNANGQLVSEDASFLLRAAGLDETARAAVNLLCFKPPLTPAVAARVSQASIDVALLTDFCRKALATHELTLVEGVGGITAPIWEDYLVADMMLELKMPALIVATPHLGGINHAVLTAAYARQRDIPVLGFIINHWDEAEAGVLEHTNIEYITRLTGLPVLGKFPFVETISVPQAKTAALASLAEQHINMEAILTMLNKEAPHHERH